MAKGEGKEMRLKILACRHVYSGRNQRGDEYTIYEVEAANAQGNPINEKLRAFTALPIGQEIDVTVTPYKSEAHGKSYTLHPRNETGTGRGRQVNELREEMDQLKGMIASLANRVAVLEGGYPANGATQVAPQTADVGVLDREYGADAPW